MSSEVIINDIKFSFDAQRAALLTDRRGGYFLTGLATRYRGWFVSSAAGPLKIIDSFGLESELLSRSATPDTVVETYANGSCTFSYHPLYPVLMVVNTTRLPVDLFFDIRHTYASTQWGHRYTITSTNGVLYIHYENDHSLPTAKGDLWIAIWGDGRFTEPMIWKTMDYAFDRARQSSPDSRFCCNALRAWGSKIAIATHESREELISLVERCKDLCDMRHTQLSDQGTKGIYASLLAGCENALLSLTQETPSRGLMAGLPWFFQRWLRDEAISLGGLQQLGYADETSQLLQSWLDYYAHHATLPNMLPVTSSSTSDGPAWFCLRLAYLLQTGKTSKKYHPFGGEQGFLRLIHQLEQLVTQYQTKRDSQGFFHSARGESWMDAPVPGDDRDGALIEIQALWAGVFTHLFEITQDKRYSVLELELHTLILSHFYNGVFLADRIGDFVIRPNVFLAHYAYPQLLSAAEWKRCFSHILPHLLTQWGGLTTIDQSHALYRAHSTGEDKSSYHRGDSWFWINAYAAKSLHSIDSHAFRKEIELLTGACVAHHLFGPVMAYGPELRGAQDKECLGSPIQTWSSAALSELLLALGPHYPYQELLKNQGIDIDFNDRGNS